uniref:WSC domain-containing protein n=1 Tax=Macrostomum lignano TaxID=282301 RepID=A0A1I8IYW4_9PLAT
VIWVSFLLATYSGFAYHLSTLFERFLQAPVLTKMTVSTLQFEFPDVYICPTNAVTFGEFFLKKSVEEKIGIYSFDLSSGRYDLELNDMTKALLSVLHSMEEIIMSYFQFFDIADAAKCRRTPSGEEYSGNVSSAVVYGFTTMTVTSINTSAFTPSPYRGVKQCMRWNDAAQKLLSLGESGLANRLLALNFSDSESRCRSPPGLPLSEFFPIASRSVFRHAGCLPLALTNSSSFNFTCYRGGLSSLETCAECCGRRSFQYMAISRQDCFCGSSIGGYENSSSVCNASCLHDNSAICGSETAVTVLQIRDNGSRPLHVANFSDLDAISSGPYCFFADELSDKLNAAFCEIPYCQISRNYDCIVSSEDKLTQQQRLSRYTGRRNVTSTGRRCMPWSQLSTIEQVLKARRGSEVGFMDEVREMLIQTPDRLEGESDNYCRPVSVVVDSVNIHGPKDFHVTATIRDSVGEHLLARQFGSDLNAGLTECSFAGQKCTKDDFLNVAHPQLGMCHKFLKQRFTANMTSTQLAESQLSIKYFTDSTDSKGQTVSNIDKLTRVVRDSRGSDATQVAFKGVNVATAQRMDVHLRFDKYSRLSTSSRPCLETTEPITYRLPSWKLFTSNEDSGVNSDAQEIMRSSNWTLKLSMLRNALLKLNGS